jgi:predicted RNA-binding protein with RPS1 domain
MGYIGLKTRKKVEIVKGKVVNIEDYGAFLRDHAGCLKVWYT